MSEEKKVHNLIRDFFGVVALAFTVFGFMALMTYSPNDPSFNKIIAGGDVVNSTGMVGAYFSDGLARVFGSGSFFFPVITAFLGWALIRGKDFHNWPLILGSGILFLVGLCSLLAIHFKIDPFFDTAVPVGGMVGFELGGFLVAWLNPSGAVLTLVTILFMAFIVMTRIPVNALVEGIGKIFKVLGTGLMLGLNGIKNLVLKSVAAAKALIGKFKTFREETQKIRKAALEPVIVTRTAPEIVVKEDKKPGKKKKGEREEFVVQDHFAFMSSPGKYQVPPLSLLEDPPPSRGVQTEKARNEILASSAILEKKLSDFGIEGRVVQVLPGPVITLFEYEPAPGIKVSRIVLRDISIHSLNLRRANDLPNHSAIKPDINNPLHSGHGNDE